MTSELLSDLEYSLKDIKKSLEKLRKYPNHVHYKNSFKKNLIVLKKKNINFQSALTSDHTSKPKIKELDSQLSILFTNESVKTKMDALEKLEMFWPEIESEFDTIKQNNHFEISEIIPNNEHKKDLLEAIDCYNSNLYPACLVMCRRSFEGALASCYKKITLTDPLRDNMCPKCQKKIATMYMGIMSLHKWALSEGLYPDKFKSLGILTADLGAGGAHPPLTNFPRDPDIAKIQIQTTSTLLKLIYSNKKVL